MAGPCSGLMVLDFSSGMPGTLATAVLADFGAEVIKVEPPTGDPLRSHPSWLAWNRGKKSIILKEGIEASYTEDWLEKLDKSEKIQKIKGELDNLPDDYREVVVLRFFEDMSVEEVSNIMEKSEENVRVIQHRAIRKLREKIKL